MRVMILDTSSANLYISFVEDDEEIFSCVRKTINNHSELLLDSIKEGLDSLNLQVKDFDKIIVGIGPGSYTGLRVSLTVAKTFAWTLNIPLYTIDSLDILGSGLFTNNGTYVIMNVAKKNYYYYKVVEVSDSKVKQIYPDSFSSIDEFEEVMNNFPQAQRIFQETWSYSGVNISKSKLLQYVKDIHPLVPNYLRKEI